MCEQVNNFKVRMARHFLPLLLGVSILQVQFHTGCAQYVEPYQSQSGVSTSFINTPVSPFNPYSQLSAGGVQTVDQSSFIQPYSSGFNSGLNSGFNSGVNSGLGSSLTSGRTSGPSQISYTFQGQQPQQQQVINGGQSTLYRTPPAVSYFTVKPESRSLSPSPQLPQQSSQQPNFIYAARPQEQFPSTIDASIFSQNVDTSSVPVPRDFVFPVEVRQPPQYQISPSFFSQGSAPSTASEEKFIPISGLGEGSKVVTLGTNPFVITSIKPKSPSAVQVEEKSNKKNPLESLRTEDIIQALLNVGKNDGDRQILVTPKSDNGRISVTEATPLTFSTTPLANVFTGILPATAVTVIPTETILSSTTPMPTTSTTTTTTTPPPPPVHFEVTTTEERRFVSRKKKITIFIRVEDAGYEAEEKENYSTKQEFREWTKTIVEPTDIYEEKTTFFKNETREVEGPSPGVDVTKVICRNFLDDKETVVELDVREEKTVCPKPAFVESGSWEERAFRRVESEVDKKLKDMFGFSSGVSHSGLSSRGSYGSTPARPADSGFLRPSIEAIQNLRPNVHDTTKRDASKAKRLVQNHGLLAEASEVKFSAVPLIHHDGFITPPSLTSKRETKPEVGEEVKKEEEKEVVEVKSAEKQTGEVTEEIKSEEVEEVKKELVKKEVKREEMKPKEVKTEDQVETTTPGSHIMVITRTPPVRPPNPYHHPTTTVIPVPDVVRSKTEALPLPQALNSAEKGSSYVPLVEPEENKETKFFRSST